MSGWLATRPEGPMVTRHAVDEALTRAKAAEAHPDKRVAVQLYWQATQSFVDRGHYENAAYALERATRLAPKQADLHNALAQCLTRLGRNEAAAAAYRRAALRAHAQGQQQWADELLKTADWLTPTHAATLQKSASTVPQGSNGTLPAVSAPTDPACGPEADLHEAETVVVDAAMLAVPATSRGRPLDAPEIRFTDQHARSAPASVDAEHVDRVVAAAIASAKLDE